jgi:hypothetical protein
VKTLNHRGIMFFLFTLLTLTAHAQVAEWAPVTKNEDGSEAEIVGYRLYYKLITETPETCPDEHCAELCPSKDEVRHSVDLKKDELKYDLKADPVFRPGALYQIQVAAIAPREIESKKTDATICVKIKGIPEAPDEMDQDESPSDDPEDITGIGNQQTNKQKEKVKEDEQIFFASGFTTGSINSVVAERARATGNTNMESRLPSNGRVNSSVNTFQGLLGSAGPANRSNNRNWTAVAYADSNRGRTSHIQPNAVEPRVVGRANNLLSNDSLRRGARVHENRASVQVVSTSKPDSADSSKNRIVIWIVGILVLLGLLLGIKAKTK